MMNLTRQSLILLLCIPALQAAEPALEPAHIIVSPWKQHIPLTKRQGVAGIERTAKGRLWAVYGRDVESTRKPGAQVQRCWQLNLGFQPIVVDWFGLVEQFDFAHQ